MGAEGREEGEGWGRAGSWPNDEPPTGNLAIHAGNPFPPCLGPSIPMLSHSGNLPLWNPRSLKLNLKHVCFLSLPLHISPWHLFMNLKVYFHLFLTFSILLLNSCVWGKTLMNFLSLCHPQRATPWIFLLFPFTIQGSRPIQPNIVPQLTTLAHPTRQPKSTLVTFPPLKTLRSQSPCFLQGTCLSPCPWFTLREDLSNHLIIVFLPVL